MKQIESGRFSFLNKAFLLQHNQFTFLPYVHRYILMHFELIYAQVEIILKLKNKFVLEATAFYSLYREFRPYRP